MSPPPQDTSPPTGLHALAIVSGLLHVPAEAGQLARSLGLEGQPIRADDILLAAKQLGLRAKLRFVNPQRIAQISPPLLRN